MSTGTLQHLSSRGIQDAHLSIAPETSLWKRSYKRVSNFAVESIDQTIVDPGWGKQSSFDISRNGDLLSDMWIVLNVKLARLNAPGADHVHWTNALGHAALLEASCKIGGNEVDRLTGLYLEAVKHEFSSQADNDVDDLVLRSSNRAELINWTHNGNTIAVDGSPMTQLYIKLPFFFADKVRSQALPCISLQYHTINISFNLRPKSQLLIFSNPSNTALDATHNGDIESGVCMSNFVFLDSMERKLFAQSPSEYIIKNVQISDFNNKQSGTMRMAQAVTFNHPVTALYWLVIKKSNEDAFDYFNFERTPGYGDDTISEATIVLNNSEREKKRGPLYFRKIQPHIYWHRTPRRPVYAYSFAAYPESWMPSGSINMSRIDNTTLQVSLPATDALGNPFGVSNLVIFAQSFNVLRIQGGMGAKKYAS